MLTARCRRRAAAHPRRRRLAGWPAAGPDARPHPPWSCLGWAWSLLDSSAGKLHTLGEVWSQFVVLHGQRRSDGHVHVQVLVRTEPAPEQYVWLGLGHVPVLQQLGSVLCGVDRVV